MDTTIIDITGVHDTIITFLFAKKVNKLVYKKFWNFQL